MLKAGTKVHLKLVEDKVENPNRKPEYDDVVGELLEDIRIGEGIWISRTDLADRGRDVAPYFCTSAVQSGGIIARDKSFLLETKNSVYELREVREVLHERL